LEINPVLETLVNDVVDDESNQSTERDKQNFQNHLTNISTEQNEKLLEEIHSYEKRIQGLIEGVGMLKERVNKTKRIF
jgi:hypothetical protein